MKLLISPSAILICCFAMQNGLVISLKNNTTNEQIAKIQLERIQSTYTINGWLFTKKIMVDEKEFIPFSHPVLTINPRYLDNDLYQMSTLLHEEFHWTEDDHPKGFASAIKEFEKLYPEAPVGGREGAWNKRSTYLHLIICDLELQVMTSLTGAEKARSVVSQWKHYQWIYEKVLNDPAVHEINLKSGLTIENLKVKR